MEEHMTKIYVDSPVFGPEDEEVYQYVDCDIDDSEGLQLESEDTLLQIQIREDSKGRDADSLDAGRYEDVDTYYDKSRPNQSHAPQGPTEAKQRHPYPSGANRTYDELNEEEEEERLEMERRNWSQRRQVEQNHIPQLDLVDSDDEKLTHQGFMDLEIDEGRNSDAYKKTAEMVWTANQRNLLAKAGAEGLGPNQVMKLREASEPYEVPKPYQQEMDELGLLPAEERSTRIQLPLPPIAHGNFYDCGDQSSPGFNLPVTSQLQPYDMRGFQPFQPYTIENSPPMAENDFSSQKPMEAVWTRYQPEYQRRRVGSDSSLIKNFKNLPTAEGVNKSKDFVKANKKEVVKKERPRKTYGEMFSKRKKKENVETGPLLRRHSEEIQIREPVPTNTSQNITGNGSQQPLSANINEQLVAGMGGFLPHQILPSHLVPVQSTAGPLLDPAEHQQHISIPIQVQGVSNLEQQNFSVDINLKLVSPDPPLHPPQPSPARKPDQQPKLTGRTLAYNPESFNAVGGQPVVLYGVLPPLAMNPYVVLPPVGNSIMNQSAETERLPPVVDKKTGRSIKTPPKGGYAEQLKKQNQPPQYKEYTLGDYRRLKKEIKTLNLGKLGPDLDTEERVEKLIKEKRKQQYSKQVKRRNHLELALRSHRDLTTDNHLQQEHAVDKRTQALEYAKKIQKPRVIRRKSDEHLTVYEHNRKAEQECFPDELEELRLLKERHNMERKELELIEMGVKTILAQNA